MAEVGFLKEPNFLGTRLSQKISLRNQTFLPFWWVQSFVNTFLEESFLSQQSRTRLNKIPSRLTLIIVDIWHHITQVANKTPTEKVVSFEIDREFSESLRRDLLGFWSMPIQFREEKSLTIVSSSRILTDANFGRTLELNFAFPLQDLVQGKFEKSNENGEPIAMTPLPQVISINRNVLRSMGAQPPVSRVASYFELECLFVLNSKFKEHAGSVINREVFIETNEAVLLKRHKSILKDAKLFYEMGALGWEANVPKFPISQMRRFRKHGPCLIWSGAHQVQQPELLQKSNISSNQFSPAAKPFLEEAKNESHPQDLNFLIQLAEFYESLNPQQRVALERQREHLSDEQFKAFVVPLIAARSPEKGYIPH